MNIKVDLFCNLSTTQLWQNWLHGFDPALYRELADHLAASQGCGHNRQKMVELMERIKARPGGWDRLTAFIGSNFPNMVEGAPAAVPAPQAVPVPFAHVNPQLLTFPRRTILDGQGDLEPAVRSFLADKLKSDYVIVGGRAYVEFVPPGHDTVVPLIPAKNWLVTRFKAERRL